MLMHCSTFLADFNKDQGVQSSVHKCTRGSARVGAALPATPLTANDTALFGAAEPAAAHPSSLLGRATEQACAICRPA